MATGPVDVLHPPFWQRNVTGRQFKRLESLRRLGFWLHVLPHAGAHDLLTIKAHDQAHVLNWEQSAYATYLFRDEVYVYLLRVLESHLVFSGANKTINDGLDGEPLTYRNVAMTRFIADRWAMWARGRKPR